VEIDINSISKVNEKMGKYSISEIINILLYNRDVDIELMNERYKNKEIEIPELSLYYISFDYDDNNELRKLKMYFNVKYIFDNKDIIIHKTVRGVHFIVDNIFPTDIGIKNSINIRHAVNDDKWRIFCGEGRGGDTLYFTSQVIWSVDNDNIIIHKEHKYNTIDEKNLLCNPFFSKIRLKKKNNNTKNIEKRKKKRRNMRINKK